MYRNAAYLGPSVVALVLAIYPLPWHLRTRNIATLSMIFWMTLLNIVHTVNTCVWVDSTSPVAKVWGDISVNVMVGYNYGLPLAHLVLAKQLESYTTLRNKSPLYDHSSRRKHRMFDLIITIFGPIFAILIHLSNMDRRYYIVERFGPMPATYWDTWGVIITAIVPICIAGAVAVYTVMALVNIHLRRQQMLSMIASDASVNRDQFYRLLFLTIAELGTCGIRAIFNLMSFQNGPQPMDHRGPPTHNLRIIEQVAWDQVTPSGRKVLNLQYFTVVACSIVFFFCFATSQETKKFYWKLLYRVCPCLPERQEGRSTKLGSVDEGFSGMSRGTSRGGLSTLGSTGTVKSPVSPMTPGKDISLEEMLGSPKSPALDKYAKWNGPPQGAYSEEAADAVYLARYDEPVEKRRESEGPLTGTKTEMPAGTAV